MDYPKSINMIRLKEKTIQMVQGNHKIFRELKVIKVWSLKQFYSEHKETSQHRTFLLYKFKTIYQINLIEFT